MATIAAAKTRTVRSSKRGKAVRRAGNGIPRGSTPHPRTPSAAESALREAVVRQLSSVREVDAIFMYVDDDRTCRVYSVIEEHRSGVFKKIMRREQQLQRRFSKTLFDFRVRAHQGRPPADAVPLNLKPAFLR